MRIILGHSTQEAVEIATGILIDKLSSHPRLVVGLATGSTMIPVYANLVRKVKDLSLNMDQKFFFMLDEYLDIQANHPSSFRSYIHQHLINPLGLKDSQFAFPTIDQSNIHSSGDNYEALIKSAGGIDFQLLGIGTNGHIGFNEPGSLVLSRTRIVELAQSTLDANKNQFEGGLMPKRALSMGIGTILEAKEILLLAIGHSKASAIKYLFNHHDDESCPATFLKSHPHFTLVLDPDAASKISLNI